MKLKKIVVPTYRYTDLFGDFVFKNIEVLFDPQEESFDSSSFNQEKNDYILSSDEIEKMSTLSARKFLNERQTEVINGKKILEAKELEGIRIFLKVNKSEFADLLGIDRSSISRYFSGDQSLRKDISMLIMERLKDEIESPGISRIILSRIRSTGSLQPLEEKRVNVFQLAEAFIRIFETKMDSITQLKLQKLLYYAQGIGFGRFQVKLIPTQFLAWEHGPVVEDVWKKYRSYGSAPLSSDPHLNINDLYADEVVMNIIKETVAVYGIYSAWVLRNKTHSESPWLETKQSEEITDELMIKFFKNAFV